jgi:glycosyltransferase involved in cell wall biosynthesis
LTWGLLGPGKGIEHTIHALALLRDVIPAPRYTIAGVTHPKVFAAQGDQYRRSLVRRSSTLGIAESVTFDDTYRDVAQLTRFVASATAVVLPYDSRDQVTSGVLVDALAAGRPVIATAFPHAVELLSSGAGIVVPHADPLALADAIRLTLTDDDAIASMAAEARRIARSLTWTAVAAQYVELADSLVHASASIAI